MFNHEPDDYVEPDGNQDVWHYHVHLFPRYAGDDLYGSRPYRDFVTAERRWAYADKLRGYFDALRQLVGGPPPGRLG